MPELLSVLISCSVQCFMLQKDMPKLLYWHADNCCSDFDVYGYCRLLMVLLVIGVLHLAHGEILITHTCYHDS